MVKYLWLKNHVYFDSEAGMDDPSFVAEKSLLDADKARNQAIILQSNTRASGIAQLLAAILTLIGVAVALIVGLGNTEVTLSVAIFLWLAVAGLLVSLFGLASVMWPRLGRMPREHNVRDFRARIVDQASAYGDTQSLDYTEGLDLQRIAFAKERGTQVTLVGMLVLSICSVVAFGLLLLLR